jgi:hypothetical protein
MSGSPKPCPLPGDGEEKIIKNVMMRAFRRILKEMMERP